MNELFFAVAVLILNKFLTIHFNKQKQVARALEKYAPGLFKSASKKYK